MKEETRQNYREEGYKGRCMLRDWSQQEDALTEETQPLFSKLWADLDALDLMLKAPSPDTVTCKNRLVNAMRQVRKLVGASEEVIEAEEAAINAIEPVEIPKTDIVSDEDSPLQALLKELLVASKSLMSAYERAMKMAPVLANIQVFKDIRTTVNTINSFPRAIAMLDGIAEFDKRPERKNEESRERGENSVES